MALLKDMFPNEPSKPDEAAYEINEITHPPMQYRQVFTRDFLDPRYRLLQVKALQRANWQCEYPGCPARGRRFGVLHLHHKVRYPGKADYEYTLDEVIIYCKMHHDQAHLKYAPNPDQLSLDFIGLGHWHCLYAIDKGCEQPGDEDTDHDP